MGKQTANLVFPKVHFDQQNLCIHEYESLQKSEEKSSFLAIFELLSGAFECVNTFNFIRDFKIQDCLIGQQTLPYGVQGGRPHSPDVADSMWQTQTVANLQA